MDLLVKRTTLTNESTIGELWIDCGFFCYTLEDMVRPDVVKIWGQTAIPHGRYEVIINFSNRFNRQMPRLLDVPGFDGILIHSGNSAANTEGCILVGDTKSPNWIGEAHAAFNRFFPLLEAALKQGKVFITIRNPADEAAPAPDPAQDAGKVANVTDNTAGDATMSTPSDATTGDLDIDQAGLRLIEQFEGLKLDPYKDPVGIWTVGYGHVIHPADNIPLDAPITQARAEELLRQDLSTAQDGVNAAITVDVTDNQYAACVSLAFNIGVGNFAHSTLARLLNAGNVQGAADQFPLWNKAGGHVLPGLVRRRAAERELFLTPDSAAASDGQP